jgi:FAD/FMN-containing dehydrogenase
MKNILTALLALGAFSTVHAAPTPKEDFVYVDEMYADAKFPGDTKTTHTVSIPIARDLSYQQGTGAAFAGGGAQPGVGYSDLPAGVYIECSGGGSGIQRWAIVKPYDGKNVTEPAPGEIVNDPKTGPYMKSTQQYFNLGLYCDAGTEGIAQGGNNVHVKVWYKKFKK